MNLKEAYRYSWVLRSICNWNHRRLPTVERDLYFSMALRENIYTI